ncbi:MAG: hypothetical protein ACREFU_18710 [Acetobacteraceae bacterium]
MLSVRLRRVLAPLSLLLAAALTGCVAYPAGPGYAYAPAYGYYPRYGYYGYYSGPSVSVGVGTGGGCCWRHSGGWGWRHRDWR